MKRTRVYVIHAWLALASTFGLAILAELSADPQGRTYDDNRIASIELTTVRSGFDPEVIWTQAYVSVLPGASPTLLVTMSQKFTEGIDNYGDLFFAMSTDYGETWSPPEQILQRQKDPDGVESVFSDVVPAYHEATGKLLATGKVFLYDPKQRPDPEIGRRAGYLVFDPKARTWGALKTVEFPSRNHSGAPILNPTFGCVQRYDEFDGSILLPFNYVRKVVEGQDEVNVSAVVRCRFDGETLVYETHGTEHAIESGRGIYEPSIIRFDSQYLLTLRTDDSAYVARSGDGLRYDPVKEWRFDDGSVLGSYNTQQHWAVHGHHLYLVYTRRGANNDHVFRHRAPLFISRVDPEKLVVHRESEAIVIPERGARLGNFGVTKVDDRHHAISAAEHMRAKDPKYEADNSVFVSIVEWEE